MLRDLTPMISEKFYSILQGIKSDMTREAAAGYRGSPSLYIGQGEMAAFLGEVGSHMFMNGDIISYLYFGKMFY